MEEGYLCSVGASVRCALYEGQIDEDEETCRASNLEELLIRFSSFRRFFFSFFSAFLSLREGK